MPEVPARDSPGSLCRMTEETPAPKVSRKHELVEIAQEVLERDGFAHMSIGEVARLAGIKPPSLYKQFTNKADIEASLVQHGLERMAAAFAQCVDEMPAGAEPVERLQRLLAAFRDFGLAHPQLYLLINSQPIESQEDAPELTHPAAVTFVQTVADAIGGDASHPLIPGVWAWAHGIISLEVVGRLRDPDATWQVLVTTVASMRQHAEG